jgi:hypothetical protein
MIRDIYSTVEYKELFFTHSKNIIQRNKFQGSALIDYFCFTQKIKEPWQEICLKALFFKNLGLH